MSLEKEVMSLPCIQVAEDESEEAVEIPCEEDGTVLISTLSSQFPGASGLKYRNADTGTFRGIRVIDERLQPPDDGWSSHVYVCVFPKVAENKRKSCDQLENGTAKTRRMEVTARCCDLIVLGLPWKTTEQGLRQYFEEYGEVLMAQVKKDPQTGQSKGFGFIRFTNYESQSKVLFKRHLIDGRWCDVKIPNSKDGQVVELSRKVFISRCTEDITANDLREYFAKYGEVTDVFVPKSFRAFAFVTFMDPDVAQSLCGGDHIIKGTSVHVGNALPKNDTSGYHNRGGYYQGSGSYNSYSGGGNMRWNQPSQGPGGSMRGGNEIANLAQLGNSLIAAMNANQGGNKGANTTPPTLSMGALNLGAAPPAVVAAALGQAGLNLLGGSFQGHGNQMDVMQGNPHSNAGSGPNAPNTYSAAGTSGYRMSQPPNPDNTGRGHWPQRQM